MSAAPRPQTPEERLTYLEAMLETVSAGIQALNTKMDKVLSSVEERASKEWVEKLEKRIRDLEIEMRSRPSYLTAGAWAALLGLMGLLAGYFFKRP